MERDKGLEGHFSEIITDFFSQFGDRKGIQIQEVYRTPNGHDQKGTSP